jgi:hypothetical protein
MGAQFCVVPPILDAIFSGGAVPVWSKEMWPVLGLNYKCADYQKNQSCVQFAVFQHWNLFSAIW